MSKTFNAPYAGAGALMPIKGDTALSSFSGKELAESSAIHGDFNQASINYSGHQNLEVRGAESFSAHEICLACNGVNKDPENHGYCENCRVKCQVCGELLDENTEGENYDNEICGTASCYEEAGIIPEWMVHSYYANDYLKEFPPKVIEEHGYDNPCECGDEDYCEHCSYEWKIERAQDKLKKSLGAEPFGAEDMDGRVVNIVGVEDKVYVTIRFPDTNEHYGYDKIFVGDIEELKEACVMLPEVIGWKRSSFGAEGGEKVLIDDILKRNPKQTVITWDTSFDGGWNNMPQAIIEGVDNMNPVIDGFKEDEIYLISMIPYEDVKGYGEGHYGVKIVWIDEKGRSQKQFYQDFMRANKGTENEGWFNDSWRVHSGFGVHWTKKNHYAESFGAEYGKRQRFGNRYVARDTKGKFISNVSVGRSLKADRRNKSKTPARSGFGHKGDAQKGASGGFKLPTDAKSLVGIGAVLGGLWAYLESKA